MSTATPRAMQWVLHRWLVGRHMIMRTSLLSTVAVTALPPPCHVTSFLSLFCGISFNSSLASGLVQSTIDVYNVILDELRPTPAKSHYTFNLRDISKVR